MNIHQNARTIPHSRLLMARRVAAGEKMMRVAADLCVSDPAGVARRMLDGGFTASYDYTLQMLNEVPYNKWREYDPEDTIRLFITVTGSRHDQINAE